MKCEKCEGIAIVHQMDINLKTGAKTERHLCEACANADGLLSEHTDQKELDKFDNKRRSKKSAQN